MTLKSSAEIVVSEFDLWDIINYRKCVITTQSAAELKQGAIIDLCASNHKSSVRVGYVRRRSIDYMLVVQPL